MKPFPQDGKLIPIVKVEDGPDGLAVVYGLSTSEAVDSDGERCHYATTKPYYKAWSEDALQTTTAAGQDASLGNIRVMHAGEVGGKVIGITFDDARKQVWIKTQAKDPQISKELRGGFYKSFSHGGRFVARWCSVCGLDGDGVAKSPITTNNNYCPKCERDVIVDYTAQIAEVSYVDKGANPQANFSYVKSDGSIELRKFADRSAAPPFAKKKTKRVAGEDLPSSAFAYVGDESDTSTWKLPIHFSTEAKSARHVRNALARFNQTKGIPEGEKEAVLARIKAAATKYGIDVEEEKKSFIASLHKAFVAKAGGRLAKGLYDVGRFAELLQGLAYLWQGSVYEAAYEEDESEVPGMLEEHINSLADALIAMCEEECRELTEVHKSEMAAQLAKKAAPAAGEKIMNEEILKALFKGSKDGMHKIAGHFKKMAEDAKDAAQIHESIAADNKQMAEAHDTAADLHSEARKSTETGSMSEAAADFHKKGAEHHKKMAEHHKKMADKCMKMHKAHMAACKACKAMGDSMEEDDAGKAARIELAKADTEDAPVVPGTVDVNDAIQKAIAAVNTEHAATLATLTKSISDLKEQVEKKANPVPPGRLHVVPRPGEQRQGGGEQVSLEVSAGAVGI